MNGTLQQSLRVDLDIPVDSFEPVKKKMIFEDDAFRVTEGYSNLIKPHYSLFNIVQFVMHLLLFEELQTLLETGDSSLIFIIRHHVTELVTSACTHVDKERHHTEPKNACGCIEYYKHCKSAINPKLFPKVKILNIRRNNNQHPFFKNEDMSPLLDFNHLTHLNLPILKEHDVTASLPTSLIFLTVFVSQKMPNTFDVRHLVNLKSLFINSYFDAINNYDLSNQLPPNLSHLKIWCPFGPDDLASLPSEITHLEVSDLKNCSMSDLPRKLIFLRCSAGTQFTSGENPPPQWEAFSILGSLFLQAPSDAIILPHSVTDVDLSGQRYDTMEPDYYSSSNPGRLSQLSDSNFRFINIIRSVMHHARLVTMGPSLSSLRYLRLSFQTLDCKTVPASHLSALKNLPSVETLRIEIKTSFSHRFSFSEPLDMFPKMLKRLEITLDGFFDLHGSEMMLSNFCLPNSLERINILRFNHRTPFDIIIASPKISNFKLPLKLKSISVVGINCDDDTFLYNEQATRIGFDKAIVKNRPNVRISSKVEFIPRCRPSSYSYPACSFDDDFCLHSYEPWGWEFYSEATRTHHFQL